MLSLAGTHAWLRRLLRRGMPRRAPATPPLPRVRRESYRELKQINLALRALRVLTGDTSIRTLPISFKPSDSSVCNLTCPHCPIHGTDELHAQHNSKKLDIEREEVVRLFDEALPAASYFHLTVAGEPFYSQHFDLYVEKAVEYQTRVQVVTNGTLLRKERLVELLPLLHSVGFSIDGASEARFEALRRGAKFDRVLRNVDLIIRAAEKAQAPQRPVFYLSHTIMASNLVELPQIVRLAHHLRIPVVQAYFIKPPFAPLECERPAHVQPLYNAALLEARAVAAELGVTLRAPDAFAGVAPSWDVAIPAGCMLAHLPNDRGARPSYASIYDAEEVEREAAELADRSAKTASLRDAATGTLSPSARVSWDTLSAQLDEKLRTHADAIRRFQQRPETPVPWCNLIEQSLYLDKFKAFLCCIEGSPRITIGPRPDVAELWNHETFRTFRDQFLSGDVPPICATCHERTTIPASALLKDLTAPLR